MTDDLAAAFTEAEAIVQPTQCHKYVLWVSLGPPFGLDAMVEAFEDAIAMVERSLGLEGQWINVLNVEHFR